MNFVFSAWGGSGSSWLIDRLANLGYDVGRRPDVVWQLADYSLTQAYGQKRIAASQQILSQQGRELPDAKAAAEFQRRAGFALDPNHSVLENLRRYFRYLAEEPHRTAVFCYSPLLSAFSRCNLQNVVFLIRHPLHCYLSYIKPGRHGRRLAELGKASDPECIAAFAQIWNGTVDELLQLQQLDAAPRIIRYEQATLDSASDDLLRTVFTGFGPTHRNVAPDTVIDELLLEYTHERFFQLYDSWDV